MNHGSHAQGYFFDSSVKALVGPGWGVIGKGKTEKGGGGDLLTRSPVRAAAVQGHTVSPPQACFKASEAELGGRKGKSFRTWRPVSDHPCPQPAQGAACTLFGSTQLIGQCRLDSLR